MKRNTILQKLREGHAVIGCGLQHFRSAEVPRVFAAAGFDYVFIDAEHGAFDLETIQDLVRASLQSGITPVVRVGELLYSLVARVLDAGAQGIILPRVEEPDRLKEALGWMRFPPAGTRGFGLMAPQVDYEPATYADIIAHMNCNTVAVAQFETTRAMERADELLSVPGLDVAMVGPGDLSISLGVPGEFEHPRLVDTVLAFIEKCKAHSVVPGIQCRQPAYAKFWLSHGMRFVGAGSEIGLLLEKARQTVRELKE